MSVDLRLARISQALDDRGWLAAAVTSEALRLDWTTASDRNVERFIVGVLRSADQTIGACEDAMPGYDESLAEIQRVDFHRGRSIQDSESLVTGLQTLIAGMATAPAIATIASMNVLVLTAATAACMGDEEALNDLETMQLNNDVALLQREGRYSDILARYSRFLDVSAIDDCRPGDFATALIRRFGFRRDVVHCRAFWLLGNALFRTRQYSSVLAVESAFFADASTASPAVLDLRTVESRLNQLFEIVDERENESNERVSQRLNVEIDGAIAYWIELITMSWISSVRLLEAGAEDGSTNVAMQCDLLDAIVGWRPGDPFDLQRIDLFIRNNARPPFDGFIPAWLESLDRRSILRSYRDAFSLACREEASYSSYEDWWAAPGAVGRTAVFGSLLLFTWNRESRDAAAQFFRECFPLATHWLATLAAFAHSAPDLPSRRTALLPAVGIAADLFGTGEFDDVHGILRTALSQVDDDEDALFERCRTAFDRSLPDAALDQLAYGLLSASGFRTGDALLSTALFSAATGFRALDPDLDLRRFDTLIAMEPNTCSFLVGWAVTCSEFYGEAPWLRRVLQTQLGIPDLRTSTEEDVLAAARSFVSTETPSFPVRMKRISFVSALAASISRDRPNLAISIVESALDVVALPDAESQATNRSSSADEVFLSVGHLADAYFTQGQFGRFLASIETCCERDANGRIAWESYILRAFDMSVSSAPWVSRAAGLSLAANVLRALREVGRSEEALGVVRRLAADATWLEVEGAQPDASGALLLAFEIAQQLLYEDPSTSASVRERIEDILERVFRFRESRDFDRVIAAGRSAWARRSLVELGNSLIVACDLLDANRRRLDYLGVEAWLTQQTLLLQFLQGRPTADFIEAPSFSNSDDQDVGDLLNRRKMLLAQVSTPTPLDQLPDADRSLANAASANFLEPNREAGEQFEWSESVSPETLARTIGPEAALLRAGFTTHGQVVWSLFRAEEDRLILAAHDAGAGSRSDRERIVDAQKRFDRRIAFLWDLLSTSAGARRSKFDRLKNVLRTVDAIPSPKDAAFSIEAIFSHFRQTKERFEEEFGKIGEESLRGSNISEERWNRWRSDTFPELNQGLSETGYLVSELNQATERFLEEVASIWPWGSLCEALHASDELVIWAEDALLGIPFAFLRRGDKGADERFLFERVSTVRSIISPLLDAWMQEEDGRVDRGLPASIASLSSLPATECQEFTELELIRAFSQLKADGGRDFAWKMAGGPTGIPGTYDVLAAELSGEERLPIALLAICGHGISSSSGVALGAEIWNGSSVWSKTADDRWEVRGACDLSAIDFLAQISCSIGRLKQDGLQDVEGFCAELFLNRARSVFAGRWILHSLEAIRHSEAVCVEYLRNYSAVAEGCSLSTAKARGRAVAKARKDWAEEFRRGKATIGINTAAAMDLYGLS